MSISYSSTVAQSEAGIEEAIAQSSTATSNWVRGAALTSIGLARSLQTARAGLALFVLAFVSYHWLLH